MQFTRNGIPCNIPKGFRRKPKVKAVKESKPEVIEHRHYAELTRCKDGLEQSVIGPVGTKEYNHAIHQGFQLASEWTIN